jgi:1-acyl-sn-glycerol-3-phosphate acyltransferase
MRLSRRLNGLFRGLLFGLSLYGTLLVTTILILPFLWSTRIVRAVVIFNASWLTPTALFLGGIRIESRGIDNLKDVTDGYILVANHSSNLDPLALMRTLGRVDLAFVAKAETLQRPLFGRVVAAVGWMGVQRDSMLALKRFQEAVKKRRKTGWTPNLVIFPEGTRSEDGSLQDFQIGPFMLAVRTGLPILPVVIRGAQPLHRRNAFAVYPGTVKVDILPALQPPKKPKASELVDVVLELQKRTEALYRAVPDLNDVEDNLELLAEAA